MELEAREFPIIVAITPSVAFVRVNFLSTSSAIDLLWDKKEFILRLSKVS